MDMVLYALVKKGLEGKASFTEEEKALLLSLLSDTDNPIDLKIADAAIEIANGNPDGLNNFVELQAWMNENKDYIEQWDAELEEAKQKMVWSYLQETV